MRFKDLIGRKSEPEVSPGRLITAPDPPVAPDHRTAPAPLADLFARLLAAEQGEPGPPAGSVPFRLSENDVQRIATRVAEQVEGALRDEVRRIVSEVTERLVREEIARIRSAAES